MPWSLKDIENSPVAHLNKHLFESEKKAAKSKYKAQKVVIDGILFHSKKEGRRYVELRMLLKAGEITDLKMQVPYELNSGGTHSLKYISDFEYERNGEHVTEDCKGYKTAIYKKKRRLMKSVWGIEILET